MRQAFTTRRHWFVASLLIFSLTGIATADDPVGLAGRQDSYFETAVAVVNEQPEIIERDGRKYSVMLKDIESGEIRPKVRHHRASGFFLAHEDDYYFVTAQHVAKKLNPACKLAFVNPTGESRTFVLGKLVGAIKRFAWKHHETADVSVMKLHLPEGGVEEVADIAISSGDLFVETPPRAAKLIVAGFPGGLGIGGGKVSPITALVHLASEEIHLGAEMEGVKIQSAYLVNPPAGKGYSGAPIFYTTADGKVKCIGILSGSWSDPTGGKFSISMPARYIKSLIDELPASAGRLTTG